MLKRGTPVIINDRDPATGGMVAILMEREASRGYWKARYLCRDTGQVYCDASGLSGNPVPLSAFGVDLNWIDQDTYTVIQTGAQSTARRLDGALRAWEEGEPRVRKARELALSLLET